MVSPKDMVHAFGMPLNATRNPRAVGEYDFEDNDLSLFLVYDYMATT